jgi:hypothetical protein
VEETAVREASKLDFLSAFGEEICAALSPPVAFDLIAPQDGYEVWLRTFGRDPTPTSLAALSESGVNQLRDACAAYHECPALSSAAIRLAVSRTLARWPAHPG